jgi:peptide/nickel transport system permease protein
MTERADADPGPVYSKDYWDEVFLHLGRRPLVKAAIAVLALLYASAIYAPLLANDRPFVLEAVDREAYESARRGLLGVARGLVELLEEGAESFERQGGSAQVQSHAQALDAEERALAIRIAAMRRHLPPEECAPLESLAQEAAALRGRAALGEPLGAEAFLEGVRELRQRYEPLPNGAPAEAEGLRLVAARSRPLLESLGAFEHFLMALWACLLAWPLWNPLANRLLGRDLARVRRARRRKLALVLALCLAWTAVAWLLFAGRGQQASVPFKKRLSEGGIEAVARASFAPIAYGFDETKTSESYRPPTWLSSSEIDPRGHFVRGPRVPVADPVTGHMPSAEPVAVLVGEPAVNSAWRHFLGTDILGRDLLVRILYGGRISLAVGLVSTLVLVVIGVLIGCMAGYLGGWVDVLLSRAIEVVQSIPAFFLILTAVALVPEERMNPILTIVIVIALVRWTGVARLVRGEFLKLKEQEFVVAARALGLRPWRVIFRHVLPNALGPVLVAAAFSVATGILTESAISFLGFGVKHPIPSWGSLLNESRAAQHWWLQVFPGLLIFLTVFCYNLVGEGIRDALDPRTKGARP